MLNIGRRLLVIAVTLGAALWFAPSAHALECAAWGDTDPNTPGLQYGCTSWVDSGGGDGGDNDSGGGGGGGSTTPSCTYFDIWNDFCSGGRACYINDPAAIQDVEEAREDTPGLADQPEDADHLIFTSCRADADSEEIRRYYWDNEIDQGPTLTERMESARGALNLPAVTPVFNPPNRTLVNLETWWWAQGAPTGEVVGSEALGLRAIASPREMVVTAAGQSVTCPIVNHQSDTCSMTFRRSGDHGATVTLTYDIRFEMNGNEVDIPSGAADLATLTATGSTTVPVREVQSLVTDLG